MVRILLLSLSSVLLSACSVTALIESVQNLGSSNLEDLYYDVGTSHDFGRINHLTTAEKTLQLHNESSNKAEDIVANLPSPFIFKGGAYPGTGGNCGSSLDEDSFCTLVIEYAQATPQSDSAQLQLTYTMAEENKTLNLALTGTSVEPAVLGISDGPIHDFGNEAVSATTAVKLFTVTNTGGEATSMIEAGLTIPYAYEGGAYPGTTGDCGTTLSAGDSCTLAIVFSPISIGVFNDDIELSYYDGLTNQVASRGVTGTGVPGNVAPVADAQSVVVLMNSAIAVTLTGSDANSDPLTYTVVANPSHGVLSGTAPNLTFTPTNGYEGADSFTFKVNDGTVDSTTETVSLSVEMPVVYLRTSTDTPAGNDTTAVLHDPTRPYETAQKAVEAAITRSAVSPVIIDVGVGNFGDVNIYQSISNSVQWRGVDAASSLIGIVTARGYDGYGASDDGFGGANGATSGDNGPALTINTDGNVRFSSIASYGGRGGDDNGYAVAPGAGGDGGNITLHANTVVTNAIDTRGGGSGTDNTFSSGIINGGNPGSVTLGSDCSTGNIVATPGINNIGSTEATAAISVSIGNSSVTGTITTFADTTLNVQASAQTGHVLIHKMGTINIYGETGTVTSTGGTTTVYSGGVTGNIQVNGISSVDPGGSGFNGGTIAVSAGATVNGWVRSEGGSGDTGNGNGGNITIAGTVTGSVYSLGGYYSFIDFSSGPVSGNGGNISVLATGVVGGDLYADGGSHPTDSQTYSGSGGSIFVAGQVSGSAYARGGTADFNSGSGGSITIESMNLAGAYATGGEVRNSGVDYSIAGNGGFINVADGMNFTGDLIASGGTNHDDGMMTSASTGGSGGTISLNSISHGANVVAVGGNAYYVPGSGGTVYVYSGSSAGTINVRGGQSSANADSNQGLGGTVTVESSAQVFTAIYAQGGDSAGGYGGHGGSIDYQGSGSPTMDVSGGTGGLGNGNLGSITP